MRNNQIRPSCPNCGTQLKLSIGAKPGVCESCSNSASQNSTFAPSTAALKDSLVYWEDNGGVRSVLKHVIVLSVIGVVALIAYYMGS